MQSQSVRIERIIAGARLVLAIASINLVLLDPSQLLHEANETYTVVALYLLYAIAVIWIVDRNLMKVGRVGLFSQAADTLWFPVILVYTRGENSPFFLYYVFSLITASFRWGFKETLFVNTANVGMYAIVHVATLNSHFEFYKFLVRPTYLYVLACLIGYLGEHQRRAQGQLLSLAELSRSIRIKNRFSGMLGELMEKVRRIFQAEQCIIIFHEEDGDRFFLTKKGKEDKSYRMVELRSEDVEFLLSPCQNWGYLVNPCRKLARFLGFKHIVAYDFDAQKPVSQPFPLNQRLVSIFEMRSMLSVPIFLNEQFKGRVYLVNKIDTHFSNSELQHLSLIVSQVGPLLENYRLLKRMQRVSLLEEKNRIARDLHDGLVQSLASLDLRIQGCLKLCRASPQEVERELAELQKIVRSEHSELRSYMKRLKAPTFAPDELVEAIQRYVRAFEKENGLTVKLLIDANTLNLPRKVSSEIYHMIHEGLTNVKRHAEAHEVSIKLNQDEATASLVISDDGRGFPSGSKPKEAPHSNEPWSIYQRTRALNGTLTVESAPGKGSRLLIRIPIALD